MPRVNLFLKEDFDSTTSILQQITEQNCNEIRNRKIKLNKTKFTSMNCTNKNKKNSIFILVNEENIKNNLV